LDDGRTQAERLEKVAVELGALLRQPEMARLASSQQVDGEWSVLQILGHLAEMIPYWMEHCRRIIAAKGTPPQFGRNHEAGERLAGVERGAKGEMNELLQLVEREIQVAVQAIRGMSPDERDRQGMHIRYGAMSVAQVIERFIVAHAEEHLEQVREVLMI
jgi:hypothetical protein